jgi:N-acetylglucosaminyl-diphospho-decaprenol L-rhamnosyltransferase
VSLTAVVVLHDSARDLAVLLDSLDEHVRPHGDLQVVCVDSGSRDEGPRIAADRGAEVAVLDGNPGFGAANNAGLAHVTTHVTVLCNPDVVLLDGGLGRLAADAAGQEALLAPRLLDPGGTIQRSAHPLPGSNAAFLAAVVHPPVLPRRARLAAEPWRARDPRPVGWAIAAVLAARTDLLRRLGPFDPAAFLFYEDLDLALRAADAGVPTILRPDVALRHVGGHSTRRAYPDEPHALQASRRREVVGARLGPAALRRDDLVQALTFATRALAHALTDGDGGRERAQLRALRRARRG